MWVGIAVMRPVDPELAVRLVPAAASDATDGSQRSRAGPAFRIEVLRDAKLLGLPRMVLVQPEAEGLHGDPMSDRDEDLLISDGLIVRQTEVSTGFDHRLHEDDGGLVNDLEVRLLHLKNIEVVPILPAGEEVGIDSELVELLGLQISRSDDGESEGFQRGSF